MKLDGTQRNEIERNLAIAKAMPDFSDSDLWLTCYLTGAPKALGSVAEALGARGWVNLGGQEGGFLYPKYLCGRDIRDVIRCIEEGGSLCEEQDVKVLHIDLDTSCDVTRSTFHALIVFH